LTTGKLFERFDGWDSVAVFNVEDIMAKQVRSMLYISLRKFLSSRSSRGRSVIIMNELFHPEESEGKQTSCG
jgi:hypothetical protein